MIGRAISHYSITEKLGEGGMGVVYRAHDLTLRRDVALKFLTLDRLEKDPQAREKVLCEAQTISALNHPNICTIYEVGEDDGQPYIAMEFVEGHSLMQEVLTGPLSADVVVRYGTQLADALAHAHERGIIHRDLKSGNVWITPSGRLKLLDFGLSQRVVEQAVGEDTTKFDGGWDDQHAVTRTLAYMAPEILRGQEADARSDVWALGVVLYEMATGKRPFRGSTAYELSASILREPLPPIVPAVPPVLQAVIEQCLDKDPSQRYRSGGAGGCGNCFAFGADSVRDAGAARDGAAIRQGTQAILAQCGNFRRRSGSDCRRSLVPSKAAASPGRGARRDSVAGGVAPGEYVARSI